MKNNRVLFFSSTIVSQLGGLTGMTIQSEMRQFSCFIDVCFLLFPPQDLIT